MDWNFKLFDWTEISLLLLLLIFRCLSDDLCHAKGYKRAQNYTSRDRDSNKTSHLAFRLSLNCLWSLYGAKSAHITIGDWEKHKVKDDKPINLKEPFWTHIEADQQKGTQVDRSEKAL